MALTREQLEEIIASGQFDRLVGEVETDWLDAKGQPYLVDNDGGKRELAKDVSAFANLGGGFILIAVRTKPSSAHFGDEVEEIRAFAQTLVNTGQYMAILDSWIYPAVAGAEVRWRPTASQSDRGVVVVSIPPQRDTLKPFLIARTLEGSKQIETMFGYSERKRDGNSPVGVADLQRALRQGFSFERTLEPRLERIELALAEKGSAEVSLKAEESERKVRERIHKTLTDSKTDTERTLELSAYPLPPSEVKSLFLGGANTIRKALENPPTLRSAGWDLETGDQAHIIRGEMVRVANGNRKILELYRDGTFIFLCRADTLFLAWGSSEKNQNINPLALIEVVVSFTIFYGAALNDLKEPPKESNFRIDFRNLHLGGTKTILSPYGLGTYAQVLQMESNVAPENEVTITRSVQATGYDPAVVAYELVREIYVWFGIEEDKIPYTTTVNGLRAIDIDAIRKQR